MMVVFVSQCEKKALGKTRRVLDAFADRIGDNTWQTVITEEGLNAVRKLLRKTASKSTAVSCHWIRTRARSDLLWVVGNRKKFNERGVVPVNYTEGEVEKYMDKEKWQSLEVIKSAVTIAGLLHDFGKANILFQAKLKGEGKNKFEPVRHEWVSLRIFQAFVGDKTDEDWLKALTEIDKNHIDELIKDGIERYPNNPIANLPPFAQLIAWLIMGHHKLPVVPNWKNELTKEVKPEDLCKNKVKLREAWFEKELKVWWNSYNFKDKESLVLYKKNWTFHNDGLPFKSTKWRLRAMKAADKALQSIKQFSGKDFLHDQLFVTHLSRLALMLADHYYSSKEEVTQEWQNPNYDVYANTENDKLKQQLDEHLIGVSKSALDIVKALPHLKSSLNGLEDNEFLKNTKKGEPKFNWQIDAQKTAEKMSESSVKQGFFGINMASTGMGKTLANAKVMYALADNEKNCRFSVALGLRTLTLQTGREYRKQMDLNEEQLAIAVGGAASKALFENEQNKKEAKEEFGNGSESIEEFLDPDLYIDYSLGGTEHSLYTWTKNNERIEKLLQAPVLVCTIDHLISATDGTKGGKQIGPMLRLLTSDLVVDEPDDFGLEDLPALCRLVHWAGMLGSRVLLSTATMPPDLAFATFQAYSAGWAEYAKSNILNWNGVINCAWFDEREKDGSFSAEVNEFKTFRDLHEKFVNKRVSYLQKTSAVKHKAAILENLKETDNLYTNFAQTILKGALQLHQNNQSLVDGKKVSIGLVRMANINPLVAVAKQFIQQNIPKDTRIHLCVYHSHYPLAIRSYLENQLDEVLYRTKTWPPTGLKATINKTKEENQIFIVLASPVAEVGRDHDYDWAIIEPSSMRSIIQIAGRILRHRDIMPEKENVLLINENIKQLKECARCFDRPGFEIEPHKLNSHVLSEILKETQYKEINAVERVIRLEDSVSDNLVALEHEALKNTLFANPNSAKLWWKEEVHWCGVLQKLQPFRKSVKDESLYLLVENGKLVWRWKNEAIFPPKIGNITGSGIEITEIEKIELNEKIQFWFDLYPKSIYNDIAKDFKISIEKFSLRFGELRLINYNKEDISKYKYNKNFGVYQEV